MVTTISIDPYSPSHVGRCCCPQASLPPYRYPFLAPSPISRSRGSQLSQLVKCRRCRVTTIYYLEHTHLGAMALLVFALCLFLACAAATPPHARLGQRLKAPYLPEGTPTPPPQWIDQRLDHLSTAHGNETWKQRYFVNATWWDMQNGPVFMMLGGEGPENPAWLVADTNIMRNA